MVIYLPEWKDTSTLNRERNAFYVLRSQGEASVVADSIFDKSEAFEWKMEKENKQPNKKVEVFEATPREENRLQEGSYTQRVYYKIPISTFHKRLKIRPSALDIEFGTATIPIKIRPGNKEKGIPFDFYGNFNAGVGLNIKVRNAFAVFGGISITSVPVDSLTTRGFLNSTTNAAALTPTFGLIKEVSGVQIGAFIGVDYLSRDLGKNWLYQGRRWFGIGISANIFKISSGASEAETQE